MIRTTTHRLSFRLCVLICTFSGIAERLYPDYAMFAPVWSSLGQCLQSLKSLISPLWKFSQVIASVLVMLSCLCYKLSPCRAGYHVSCFWLVCKLLWVWETSLWLLSGEPEAGMLSPLNWGGWLNYPHVASFSLSVFFFLRHVRVFLWHHGNLLHLSIANQAVLMCSYTVVWHFNLSWGGFFQIIN